MKVPFYSRYGLVVLVVSAFLFPVIGGGALRALRNNRNEVEDWLPPEYEETTDFRWFCKHFVGGQFVLMSWEGCTLDDPRLPRLAESLMVPRPAVKGKPAPPFFHKVVQGQEVLQSLIDPPNSLPRDQALARLEQALIGCERDGKRQTCAVVYLTEEGEEAPRVTLDYITARAAEVGIPAETLHMGGPPVDNVALDKTGEASLMRLAAITGVVGLLISWWCLRSPKLIAMVFSVSVASAAAALAVVWFTGGQMNSILLTMPPLVYVATMSGAIHLSNYYRDTLNEGDPLGAPGRAIKHAWLPLSLATGTTAVGLLSLFTSELVPIRMFGLYSSIGVVISLFVLFFLLPALLQFFPLKKATRASDERSAITRIIPEQFWRRAGEGVMRFNLPISAACFVVLGFGFYGITKIQTSVNLMNFFDPDTQIIHDYRWLEQNIGPLVPMEVTVRFDKECPLTMSQRLEVVRQAHDEVVQLDEVGSALSAATFSPQVRRVRIPGMGPEAWKRLIDKRLEAHREEFVENDYLAVDDQEEIWRISARVEALRNVDYGAFVQALKDRVNPVIDAQADAGVPGVKATYTGLVPLIYKAQRSLLNGLALGFVMDMVLVCVVLMIVMRDVGAGLLLAFVSMYPAVLVFGYMGYANILVDVGTVMPPSVALGVTVDDIVHFLIWYRKGLQQGRSRRQSIMLAYEDCAQAMYQSWGVIGLGLSVFALSPFTPTQRFGYLMGSLLTVALFGNLVFMPALLASPLGWLFCPRLTWRATHGKVKPEDEEAATEAPAAHVHAPASPAPTPVGAGFERRQKAG